jgi:hypothetical protein
MESVLSGRVGWNFKWDFIDKLVHDLCLFRNLLICIFFKSLRLINIELVDCLLKVSF